MAQVEMKMPKMGESVAEATIIRWLKKEGDPVEADESVLEIATDKVDSEVPSSVSGIMGKRLFNEGDVVQVGSVIAIINTGGETTASAPSQASVTASAASAAPSMSSAPAATITAPAPALSIPVSAEGRFYSPLVRTIAKTENISQ